MRQLLVERHTLQNVRIDHRQIIVHVPLQHLSLCEVLHNLAVALIHRGLRLTIRDNVDVEHRLLAPGQPVAVLKIKLHGLRKLTNLPRVKGGHERLVESRNLQIMLNGQLIVSVGILSEAFSLDAVGAKPCQHLRLRIRIVASHQNFVQHPGIAFHTDGPADDLLRQIPCEPTMPADPF